jgi:tetratricopeptide (TPR) repeat protein
MLAAENGPPAADALRELGNITARREQYALAEQYYISSLTIKKNAVQARIKLALLYIQTNRIPEAKRLLRHSLDTLMERHKPGCAPIATMLEQSVDAADLLLVVAALYYSCGKLLSLGFWKQFHDTYPDTAYEAALLAWKAKAMPAAMDLLLDCLKEFNMEGEMLPELTAAIQEARLTDGQILRTVEIARQYYDVDLAGTIVAAFRRTLPL